MSLLPVISKLSIEGRSSTTTMSVAAVAPKLHVAEEAGGVERADGLAHPLWC